MSKDGPMIPILAGAAGAGAVTLAADQLGVSPTTAAWGTVALATATALGTGGLTRQVATGIGAASMGLGALQLISQMKHHAVAKKESADAHGKGKRAAEGESYITRQELNDALARMADQQQKGQCDLVATLDEMKRVIVAAQSKEPPKVPVPKPQPAHATREASGEDDYARNAYGDGRDDERNALVDEYHESAYGPRWERNASEYDERNAYADDERNAYVEDERNAVADEERNAYVDDERNASEYEERNAVVDEERNSSEYDERNAVVDEERNAVEEAA